jgi:pimeloyl-ACP methyl ester carboxylesterase
MGVVFKGEESQRLIANISEQIIQDSCCEYKRTSVATSFGETSILLTPPDETKPSLFIMHGGSGNAAITGWLFDSLSKKYNLIIPDIIGGPGSSAEKFLSPNSDEYGEWFKELITIFKIDKVNFLAISQGAYTALRYIELDSVKLNKVILYVPAAFIKPRLLSSTFKFMLPLIKLRLFKFNFFYSYIERNIFSEKPNELISSYFKTVFMHTRFDIRQPKMIMDKCPIKDTKAFVISAENDLFFSGAKLQARAIEYFGEAVQTKLLQGANHSLTKSDIRFNKLLSEVEDFLDEE